MKKCLCLILFLLAAFMLAGCNKTTKDKSLYGKYPDAILKAISEKKEINKSYRDLTTDDLAKAKIFYFEREYDKDYIDKKYGLEQGKTYDFSILGKMPNLRNIYFHYGNEIHVKSYDFLKDLKNLEILTVENIDDNDIKYIKNIKSLKYLDIFDSKITSIDFLKNLSQLEMLHIDGTPTINDYGPLKYLKNTHSIMLTNNDITDERFSTIPDLNTVTSLDLSKNNINTIFRFPLLPNLEALQLSSNNIKSLDLSSAHISKLEGLYIDDTDISDINDIKGADSIEYINLLDTKINRLSPLNDYKNLETIYVNKSNIIDMDQLKNKNIKIYNSL